MRVETKTPVKRKRLRLAEYSQRENTPENTNITRVGSFGRITEVELEDLSDCGSPTQFSVEDGTLYGISIQIP